MELLSPFGVRRTTRTESHRRIHAEWSNLPGGVCCGMGLDAVVDSTQVAQATGAHDCCAFLDLRPPTVSQIEDYAPAPKFARFGI